MVPSYRSKAACPEASSRDGRGRGSSPSTTVEDFGTVMLNYEHTVGGTSRAYCYAKGR